MKYAKHLLMILFISFILVPVILSRMKEGYCDDEFYKLIRQKLGDTTMGTVTVGANCNSNYYNMIKSKLDSINFTAPSFTFSSFETTGVLPSKLPAPKATCPPGPESIKCVADFGTRIGEPLCCGQKGVLQNTQYVCPNTLKKCSNFKCGSAFGTCI